MGCVEGHMCELVSQNAPSTSFSSDCTSQPERLTRSPHTDKTRQCTHLANRARQAHSVSTLRRKRQCENTSVYFTPRYNTALARQQQAHQLVSVK
ncbi:hypothetical protein VTO73DRAFT_9001 [Trametes versicolor]